MKKQYKQFYVIEANFKRSFTGHGPDAIDAEMLVEGEFGQVYLTYNDFCGERFGVSKTSVIKQLESDDPEPIEFLEQWEGGLADAKGSRFYLGFKELAEFSDRMAYLNVNYKNGKSQAIAVDGDKVMIGGRNVGKCSGYTKIDGAKHGLYVNVDGKEYLVKGKLKAFIESIQNVPPCEFTQLLHAFVADLEPDIVDGVAVKKSARKVKKSSKAK